MVTRTLAEIKDKLQRMETELHDVLSAVQELEAVTPQSQHANGHTALAPAAPEHPLAALRAVDKEPLREIFREMMKDMGIENLEPIGAEALQEQMRQQGIKAEDNILSRGIIEMREE